MASSCPHPLKNLLFNLEMMPFHPICEELGRWMMASRGQRCKRGKDSHAGSCSGISTPCRGRTPPGQRTQRAHFPQPPFFSPLFIFSSSSSPAPPSILFFLEGGKTIGARAKQCKEERPGACAAASFSGVGGGPRCREGMMGERALKGFFFSSPPGWGGRWVLMYRKSGDGRLT